MKKLPPYGKPLANLLAQGKLPNNSVYCFCGKEAWQRAAASAKCRLTLCLPFGTDPFDFNWPVAHCDILIYSTGGMQRIKLERFTYCLLHHKAFVVRVISNDYSFLFKCGGDA